MSSLPTFLFNLLRMLMASTLPGAILDNLLSLNSSTIPKSIPVSASYNGTKAHRNRNSGLDQIMWGARELINLANSLPDEKRALMSLSNY